MKRCIKCGKDIADDSTVCEHCNTNQEVDAEDTKKYTDSEVNRIVASNKRDLREENKVLKERLEEMDNKLSSVDGKLGKVDDLYNIIIDDTEEEDFFEEYDDEEYEEEEEDGKKKPILPNKKHKNVKDAVEAARYTMELKYKKILAEQGKRIGELEVETQAAKDETFETKKTEVLNSALVTANVKSHLMEEAAILLRKNVIYDDIDEKWFFKTSSGADIDLKDGIINTLKAEFLVSFVPGAGSGGKGAVSKEVDKVNTLRKRYKIAEEEAAKYPTNDMVMMEYTKLRKELIEAEKTAKSSGAIL